MLELNFTNFEQAVSSWLLMRPEQSRLMEANAISYRAVNRALPYIGRGDGITTEQNVNVILAGLWSVLVLKLSALPLNELLVEASNSAAGLVRQAGENAVSGDIAMLGAYAAAAQGLDSFVGRFRNSYRLGIGGGVAFAHTTLDRAHGFDSEPSTAFWEQMSDDISKLENGLSATDLILSPLWGSVHPLWNKEYSQFLDHLTSPAMSGFGFDIWSEWYRATCAGEPVFGIEDFALAERLEYNIALGGRDGTFHPEFWQRNPTAINANIKRWVEKARAAEALREIDVEVELPAQTLAATLFGLSIDGRVERIAVPPEQQLLITAQQQNEYDSLRKEAGNLSGQGQVLGKLAPELTDLANALPADMSHANVYDLWRAINRLRRTMNAHQAVFKESEPHFAKLDKAIAEDLGALLDIANNFAFGDPGIRSRDENSIPPQDKPALDKERKLGDSLAKAALNTSGLLTDAAETAVQSSEKNAMGAGEDAHGLQAVQQTNKDRKNLFAAILSAFKGEVAFSWKEFRGGAYKAGGAASAAAIVTDIAGTTAFYPTIGKFIVAHAVEFLRYAETVFQNPTVTKLLELIVKGLGG